MAYWIVVVDDDAIELKNARNLLGSEEIRVSCLRSGAALLKFMETNEPDLVLLDIMMPEMDGFETFHALRALERDKNRIATPIIFLSGDGDSETEKRGLKDGASDFIKKPFDKEILISRVVNTIENHKTIESLTEKASVDRLTGFLNKISGTEKIKALCREYSGALMILDLDNFKLVNDIYGHDMGDEVLIAFSDIIRYNTRAEDTISRIGGDEFLAFFSSITSANSVKALTDRLNEQLLSQCIKLMGKDFDIPIGISVGVAMVPQHSRDFTTLFKLADSAMYRVKQNGKHGVMISDTDLSSGLTAHNSNLESEMTRINTILEERGTSEGAMIMGKDTFIQAYRYTMRFLKRYQKGAEKLLFLLSGEEPESNISEITPEFIELLRGQLRKSDAIVQIRSDQILVFLPIITQEEAERVASRIIEAFGESGIKSVKLQYFAEHISFD